MSARTCLSDKRSTRNPQNSQNEIALRLPRCSAFFVVARPARPCARMGAGMSEPKTVMHPLSVVLLAGDGAPADARPSNRTTVFNRHHRAVRRTHVPPARRHGRHRPLGRRCRDRARGRRDQPQALPHLAAGGRNGAGRRSRVDQRHLLQRRPHRRRDAARRRQDPARIDNDSEVQLSGRSRGAISETAVRVGEPRRSHAELQQEILSRSAAP